MELQQKLIDKIKSYDLYLTDLYYTEFTHQPMNDFVSIIRDQFRESFSDLMIQEKKDGM
jgi:hypothetical protein